jgi:predicted GIY-YIG superfamily endonuclease
MDDQNSNMCRYFSCNRPIQGHRFLCAEHYRDWKSGLVDECPNCGQFKNAEYKLCLNSAQEQPQPRRKSATAVSDRKARYAPESSKAWIKGDKRTARFFVYILKLDGGDFYVGHTRELRERMSEHRDNTTVSTAGRHPSLRYFEILPSRETAASREAELKELARSNPRQIRRLIIGFQDLVRLVQLE